MTPPTRLEHAAQEIVPMFGDPDIYRQQVERIVQLLRREQARAVRIVKQQPKAKGHVEDLISRDDLLAALRKGTR